MPETSDLQLPQSPVTFFQWFLYALSMQGVSSLCVLGRPAGGAFDQACEAFFAQIDGNITSSNNTGPATVTERALIRLHTRLDFSRTNFIRMLSNAASGGIGENGCVVLLPQAKAREHFERAIPDQSTRDFVRSVARAFANAYQESAPAA